VANDFKRTDRINASMQKALAQIVRDEVKDPRLGMITIQAVHTVRDLSQAKVFFTMFPDGDRREAQKILQNAGGFIRHALGRAVKLRNVPELLFIYDTSVEEGSRLQALIEDVVRHDEAVHADDESTQEKD
jgi:ribosome-binding factor A